MAPSLPAQAWTCPKSRRLYMGTAAYQKFAQDTFTREKALIEKLGLAKPQ